MNSSPKTVKNKSPIDNEVINNHKVKNSAKSPTNLINILDAISDDPSDKEINALTVEIQRRHEIERMNTYKKECIVKKKALALKTKQ